MSVQVMSNWTPADVLQVGNISNSIGVTLIPTSFVSNYSAQRFYYPLEMSSQDIVTPDGLLAVASPSLTFEDALTNAYKAVTSSPSRETLKLIDTYYPSACFENNEVADEEEYEKDEFIDECEVAEVVNALYKPELSKNGFMRLDWEAIENLVNTESEELSNDEMCLQHIAHALMEAREFGFRESRKR